jgi:hypothetical protein
VRLASKSVVSTTTAQVLETIGSPDRWNANDFNGLRAMRADQNTSIDRKLTGGFPARSGGHPSRIRPPKRAPMGSASRPDRPRSFDGGRGDRKNSNRVHMSAAAAPKKKLSTTFQRLTRFRADPLVDRAVFGGIRRSEFGCGRSFRGKRRFSGAFCRCDRGCARFPGVSAMHGSTSPECHQKVPGIIFYTRHS